MKRNFCIAVDKDKKYIGTLTDGDVRRGLLVHLNDLNGINPGELLNMHPTTIPVEFTVNEMLQLIKNSKFPISYLPVVSKGGVAKGIVTFVNLIKGEL